MLYQVSVPLPNYVTAAINRTVVPSLASLYSLKINRTETNAAPHVSE